MNQCHQAQRAPLTNVDARLEPFGISRRFEPNRLYLLHLERLGESLEGVALRVREHNASYVRTFIFDSQDYRPTKLLQRSGARLPAWSCGEGSGEGASEEESVQGGRALGLEILFDRPVTPKYDSFWLGFQLTQPTELVVSDGSPFIGLVSRGPFDPSGDLSSLDLVDGDPSVQRPQITLFYTA